MAKSVKLSKEIILRESGQKKGAERFPATEENLPKAEIKEMVWHKRETI